MKILILQLIAKWTGTVNRSPTKSQIDNFENYKNAFYSIIKLGSWLLLHNLLLSISYVSTTITFQLQFKLRPFFVLNIVGITTVLKCIHSCCCWWLFCSFLDFACEMGKVFGFRNESVVQMASLKGHRGFWLLWRILTIEKMFLKFKKNIFLKNFK